jgi:hypothetical protein
MKHKKNHESRTFFEIVRWAPFLQTRGANTENLGRHFCAGK